jgi:hypothetical protein
MVIKQEQELTKEKIQNLKQQLTKKNLKSKSISKVFNDKLKEKIKK